MAQTANITVTYADVANNGMSPSANGAVNMNWNFDDTSITTFNGWQYCGYWDNGYVDGNGVTQYRVALARRKLSPLGAWETISLTGYNRNQDIDPPANSSAPQFGDGHERVSIGISPDGYIHVAFDHHVDHLHYRVSTTAIANNPDTSGWDSSLFTASRRSLNPGGTNITNATYPKFIADYANGKFILNLRSEGSGNADSHLYNYNSSTHLWDVTTMTSSRFIDNLTEAYSDGHVSPYPAGFDLNNNTIHLIWTWRGTPDAGTCFNIAHAYSIDLGATWRNGAGKIIGYRGQTNGSGGLVNAHDEGVTGVTLGLNRVYNAEFSMTMDSAKNIYVNYKDRSTGERLYRKRTAVNGQNNNGTWGSALSTPNVSSTQLVTAPNNSVFLVSKSGVHQLLNNGTWWLAAAKPVSASYGPAEISVDFQRLKSEGVISVIGQNSSTQVFTVDYSNLPAPQ